MDYLKKLQAEFTTLWSGLNQKQKAIYAALAVCFVVGLTGIMIYASRPQYVALYEGISEDEAAKVKTELDRLGEKYQIVGTQILVDIRRRDTLRMEMSTKNVAPKGGITGYELLDGINITQTSADRETAKQRALQGELARAIKTMDGITDAVVILAQPPDKIYADEQQPVTASVKLTLAGDLKPEEAQAIVGFVTNAVPGLTAANVKITDQRIRNLTPDPEEGGSLVGMKAKQQELEKAIVRGYEKQLLTALATILGQEKVTVRVNVAMDFDRVEKDITNLTKPGFEQLLESVQTEREVFRGVGFKPGGVAGTESNIPNYPAASEQPMEYERTSETKNLRFDTTHTTRVQSPFIKRLTATVNIDGTYELKKDAEGNVTERTYKARTPEELNNIETMAKQTLGFDATRGDVVSVTNIPFDRSLQFDEEDVRMRQDLEKKKYVFFGLAAVVATILVILLLLELSTFLQLREARAQRQREISGRESLQPAIDQGMLTTLTIEEKEKMELRKRAERAAKDDPETVANLIRTWLLEEKE